MTRIFISYRRADSADITGRIDDRLAAHFGRANVFRDTQSISKGEDFVNFVAREIDKADVMLVIMGKDWATIEDAQKRRRLAVESDLVRVEVESGLKASKIRVIPVLVNGAAMPAEKDLPSRVLKKLLRRNASVVRAEPDFGQDIETLIEDIQQLNVSTIDTFSFKKLPRPLQIFSGFSAFILFLAAVVSCIFTVLPANKQTEIWELVGLVTPVSDGASIAPYTLEFTNSISEEALRVSLRDLVSDPRGLIVGPSTYGKVIWGYSDVGSGLFAVDIATGVPVNIWEPQGTEDPRLYPVSQLFDNARTSALYFDGTWLWLGDSRNNRVLAFDPLSLELMISYEFGAGNPVSITSIGNTVWIALQDTNTVMGFTIDYDQRTTSNVCPSAVSVIKPSSIVPQGHTALWVASVNGLESELVNVNALTCQTATPLSIKDKIVSVVVQENDIWIVTSQQILHRLENNTLEVVDFASGINTISEINGAVLQDDLLWISTKDPALHAINVKNGTVRFSYKLDSQVSSLLIFGVQIWVSMENNTLYRYTRPSYIHPGLVDIVWQQETLWLIDETSLFCRISDTETCVDLDLESVPVSLSRSVDENSLWLGTQSGEILQLNLTDYDSRERYKVPFEANFLAEQGDYLWVTDGLSRLLILDLNSGEQYNPLEANFNMRIPTFLSYDGTSVWFTYFNPLRVTTVSFADGTLRQTTQEASIQLGSQVMEMEAHNMALYLSSPGMIYALNLQSKQILDSYAVDQHITNLAIGDDALWAANRQNGFIYHLNFH